MSFQTLLQISYLLESKGQPYLGLGANIHSSRHFPYVMREYLFPFLFRKASDVLRLLMNTRSILRILAPINSLLDICLSPETDPKERRVRGS